MSSAKGHAESPTAQQRLEHLNGVLRAIRSVNQLIAHEKDPDALIRRACSLLVETRSYYSAWIVLLNGEGNLRTAAEADLGDAFPPMVERLQRGELTACGLRALAERGVRVIDAPGQECVDCPLSHSCEGRSGMTVRLEHGGATYGLMSVSVPAEYAQDDEEAELLQEVAGDIAYAVHNLAVEDEWKRAEGELRQSEAGYRAVFENSGTAMATIEEDTTISLVNHQFEALSGYSREEIEGKKSWVEFVVGGDLERMKRHHGARRTGEPTPAEHVFRFVDRHGNVKDTQLNEGLIPGTMKSVVSLQDITGERYAQDRLQESFIDLVETMTRSMESLDPYTSGHQRRVARLADLVGRELGMDDDRLQGLYIGALLHDIGKLSVPSTILSKPGRLTEQEWNIIRAHPRRGYDILKEANLPWPVAEMALRHHERLDGSGYPDGVKGPELSLEVRILGVCDAVEAMGSDRPYRPARPTQEVMREIRTGSGQRYDPQVVEVTLKVIESGAFPLGEGCGDAAGGVPGEEVRPSYARPIAGEGLTVVEQATETGGGAPGRETSGGNRPEEQPREELLNLAETLARAMSSRDPSTTNHQRRVAEFVVQVGSRLGLPAERLWGLRLGGLLHDVGKIAVPELILTKPGRLSREELELVRTHPEAGYEILRDAGLPPVVPLLALHHHELLDGSGYPQGLSGDALSLEDRILSVCNIVEAMGAHRLYRRGLGKEEVIAEIVAGRGIRYEPTVVDCVLELLESGEFVLVE